MFLVGNGNTSPVASERDILPLLTQGLPVSATGVTIAGRAPIFTGVNSGVPLPTFIIPMLGMFIEEFMSRSMIRPQSCSGICVLIVSDRL